MIFSGANVIELRAVSHHAGEDAALQNVSLAIPAGTLTILRGEAHSGCAAVLRILGLLEAPASGAVLVQGAPAEQWTEEERADYRTRHFAFLFTSPFLLPSMSAIENVAMPIFKRRDGITPQEAGERASALLSFTGLSGREQSVAGDLPRPEQYRVALARALATEPSILLVEGLDTTLDVEAVPAMAALLRQIARERGVAVVATASAQFLPVAGDRLADIVEGRHTAALAEVPLK